jgi:hypothetical protein
MIHIKPKQLPKIMHVGGIILIITACYVVGAYSAPLALLMPGSLVIVYACYKSLELLIPQVDEGGPPKPFKPTPSALCGEGYFCL